MFPKNLGVMQGRLSKPVKNHIQEFPFENWRNEFNDLQKIGLAHIEWIVTKNSLANNPLKYENLSTYPISSICLDNLIDRNFYKKTFLSKNLDLFCKLAIKNNIKRITIPLLEESDITDSETRKKFNQNISYFAKKYQEILFCFEIEAHWEAANDIVLNYDNFKLTYDTGNITALELDHVEYIKNVHRSIEIIHLKDKSTKTGTVPFGQGDTDFESIFKNIKRLELQDKIFTIQGARQSNTPEKETIKQYIKYVRGIF